MNSQQLARLSRELSYCVFLDSNSNKNINNNTCQEAGKDIHNIENGEALALSRWDIFSAEPVHYFNDTIENNDPHTAHFSAFCDAIYSEIHTTNSHTKLPFTHGLMAYCSYDAGENLRLKPEALEKDKREALQFPEQFVGFYTWSYVYEHESKQGYLSFSPYCKPALRQKILASIYKEKESPPQDANPLLAHSTLSLPELAWSKSQGFAEYAHAFNRIQEYIKSGDCYQVNLTQRFQAESEAEAADLYFSTREDIATPYSCFFKLSDSQHLMSFSPEQFICIQNA